jgi:PAS domain S-box-containing protein
VDPLTLLLELAFFVLFGVTFARWWRRRTRLDRDVLLAFAPMAFLFTISFVISVVPALGPLVNVSVAVLLAQPWLTLRLVRHFRELPRALLLTAFGFAVLGTVLNAVLTSRVVPVLVFNVVGFLTLELVAAAAMWAESRRRIGVARWRLALTGLATAAFGVTILLSGIASLLAVGGTRDPALVTASRFAALIAAGGYVIAFVTPRLLTSLPHRALAFGLSRDLVAAPTGTDPLRLWDEFARRAIDILEAEGVAILSAAPATMLASAGVLPASFQAALGGEPDRVARQVAESRPGQPVVIRRLADDGTGRGASAVRLIAVFRGSPMFLDDDLELVSLLGSMTARAIDREHAIAELDRTRAALAESTALQASELRFRALLDEHPNGVVVADDSGRIVFANRLAAELFGRPVGELIGVSVEALMPEGSRTNHANLRRAFAANPVRRPMGSGRELVAARPDGTTFPVEIALSPFQSDGELLTIAVITDISERRATEEVRDTFLGILSHELRTPVTSIYGGTQLLLNRPNLSADAGREILSDVAAEAERLNRMIENLLVLARVERGADLTTPQPILIRRVIPALVDLERSLWPGVDFRFEVVDTSPVVVAADADSLAQIVRNLLSNAAKYAGDAGPIEVGVVATGADVALVVRDHGPGITAVESERLFELYYRADATARQAPGAGIGLFVSRKLAEAMGGRLTARPCPDGGAEFRLTLPAYVDAADRAGELEPEPADEDLAVAS